MDDSLHEERGEERAGLRSLDTMIEGSAGMTRQQKDRERATPRDDAADLKHPMMERKLPIPDSMRGPLSSRQRKARSADKRAAQDQMPQTQYNAMHQALTNDAHWRQINDVLSENTGDAQALGENHRVAVQRMDRAIQSYEKRNQRGHVVYANVEMPPMINASNLEGFVRNQFRSGAVLEFDRYTGGAHTMHQVEVGPESAARTAVFEIQTRRGIYLGRSDSVDDTAHVLPRGVRFKVVGTHLARYVRPDGSQGRRQVIQMIDVSDEPENPKEN